ncbi:TetR/AcrR family transcriptional regulator [Agriterribacter sp.]|uniref:TetR/AcrR family transcriptional regulator n=1 Tax=Agriterribacter sp. TaxID=2821509 RepID=UPI002CDB8807|nr:TetR/AcrR family transcriptional regulator [Agriterribacter sp.]HRO45244.1 TetR/AcrR family transcriptional regulator [Agriterribacter sp.]HRQ16847.1 TetR/AcrR family transcriptional regulator [Agriterribacter sp.]
MRKKDENKEIAIREKAMEMIVIEGFDGLSMQKLARAANISASTIYIYFKNREDLLNQLFIQVQETFSHVALTGFSADLSLEEGLWLQWKNRLRFILKYPVHYQFYEQFRNSPLINNGDVKLSVFKNNMKHFVLNAIRRGELVKMEPEIFWSLAYGSFYALVRFHLNEKSMMNENFKLTDTIMKQTFKLVIKALQPE